MVIIKRFTISAFLCILVGFMLVSTVGAQSEACAADTDFIAVGQSQIDSGDYESAIASFTCAIEANPAELDAYRGRIEASLLAGEFVNAMNDYTQIGIHVIPQQPEAFDIIVADYLDKLASDPNEISLLTGYSFAQWWISDYEGAVETLNHLLDREPGNLYALLLRGSSQVFIGDMENGYPDFDRALELASDNPDVHFYIADAYLYGIGDTELAFEAANAASELGLDTARLNAILATTYLEMGDEAAAVEAFARHIERSTLETVEGDPLERGQSVALTLMPGQTYIIPVEVEAGETLRITTDSADIDSLMVLLASDGTLVTGNDDFIDLNAGFEREIEEAGLYTLLLTSFEGAGTGEITVTRGG